MGEPTAVVFDLDDTLYPERRFALSGYAAVSQALAVETGMPARVIFRFLSHRYRSHGREGLFQALCRAFALPLADVPRLVAILRTHRPRLRLPRRSRDLLVALRARGHRLGVLTNGLPATQRAKVAALHLEPFVDAVVYAQEHAPDGKPARVCFTAVLGRLGVVAERTVFVGDHPDKDIAGAAAAGMHPIWVAHRPPVTPAGATAASAGDVAVSLEAVPALVASVLEARHAAPC